MFPTYYYRDQIVGLAIEILDSEIRGDCMDNPARTQLYLRLKLASLEHEVFSCLFLDTRRRVICFEEMFRGTVDTASIHPREVVKDDRRECL